MQGREYNKVIKYSQDTPNHELKPFIKWAGSKTRVIHKLTELIPNSFETYYEPFLGSGALLFYLKPAKAVVSDINTELIITYNCFKNKEEFTLMIKEILNHEHNHSEEYYYQVRSMDRMKDFIDLPNYKKAARMIYLNKACFNGMYRVNSSGFFNVPADWVRSAFIHIYDKTLYNNLSKYLSSQSIVINNDDFEKAVSHAKSDDFVYFDPPYDEFNEKHSFINYTKNAFGKDEQKRLASVFKDLNNRGVKVMLSNHDTEFIRELYSGFNIKEISVRRTINSKSTDRGYAKEVIITNYTQEDMQCNR